MAFDSRLETNALPHDISAHAPLVVFIRARLEMNAAPRGKSVTPWWVQSAPSLKVVHDCGASPFYADGLHQRLE